MKETIEGEYYSGEFYPGGNDDAWSNAYGVVKPPFDLSRADGLVETLTIGGVTVEEYASTLSATVLQLECDDVDLDRETSHDERLKKMEDSLRNIIRRLNDIEGGRFPSVKE